MLVGLKGSIGNGSVSLDSRKGVFGMIFGLEEGDGNEAEKTNLQAWTWRRFHSGKRRRGELHVLVQRVLPLCLNRSLFSTQLSRFFSSFNVHTILRSVDEDE